MNLGTEKTDVAGLMACADRLEGAMTLMHGSAYQPSLKAVRCLRAIAADPEVTDEDAQVLAPVVEQLKHFALTVNPFPRERMLSAATMLETFLVKASSN